MLAPGNVFIDFCSINKNAHRPAGFSGDGGSVELWLQSFISWPFLASVARRKIVGYNSDKCGWKFESSG
jgi:hypothetical protein